MSTDLSIQVIKVGGSILTDPAAYGDAARALRCLACASNTRLVVVVSAQAGHTDALLGEAQSIVPSPGADALDLLWSTGELRSVALLTLALREAGVRTAGFNAHETGLVHRGDQIAVNTLALRAALSMHDVVVVPGFVAIRNVQVVTIGRGGSDLSAVRLAVSLRAASCTLLKDVDGYFTADPAANPAAVALPHLTFEAAFEMAQAGCPLVQAHAIAAARAAALPLIVRSMRGHGTTVS